MVADRGLIEYSPRTPQPVREPDSCMHTCYITQCILKLYLKLMLYALCNASICFRRVHPSPYLTRRHSPHFISTVFWRRSWARQAAKRVHCGASGRHTGAGMTYNQWHMAQPPTLNRRSSSAALCPSGLPKILSSACFSASEARVAAHGFTRGIRGVCELVHTLEGLEHPEITRYNT